MRRERGTLLPFHRRTIDTVPSGSQPRFKYIVNPTFDCCFGWLSPYQAGMHYSIWLEETVGVALCPVSVLIQCRRSKLLPMSSFTRGFISDDPAWYDDGDRRPELRDILSLNLRYFSTFNSSKSANSLGFSLFVLWTSFLNIPQIYPASIDGFSHHVYNREKERSAQPSFRPEFSGGVRIMTYEWM